MKKFLAAFAVAGLLAGCSPSGDTTQSGVSEPTAQPAFTPTLFEAPILRFYEPDFSYHLRSVDRDVLKNGRTRVRNNMEIRSISQQEAAEKIDASFIAAGYEQRGRGWKDGVYQVNYRQSGRSTVFVVIRDIAQTEAYDSPDATGWLRISWTYRPRS